MQIHDETQLYIQWAPKSLVKELLESLSLISDLKMEKSEANKCVHININYYFLFLLRLLDPTV